MGANIISLAEFREEAIIDVLKSGETATEGGLVFTVIVLNDVRHRPVDVSFSSTCQLLRRVKHTGRFVVLLFVHDARLDGLND